MSKKNPQVANVKHISNKELNCDFRGTTAIKPLKSGHIELSDGTKLFYKLFGNANGVPATNVHGGPGYHSDDDDRCCFDPSCYKIVLFDQRGCGQSEPRCKERTDFSKFSNVTLAMMVEDMEAVRTALFGSAKWVVAGVSWGSALALAYTQRYPSKVHQLIIQGIYTGSIDEHRPLFNLRRTEEDNAAWQFLLQAARIDPADKELVERCSADPVWFHSWVASVIASTEVSDRDANRLLSSWEMYENYVTYPKERKSYLKALEDCAKKCSDQWEADGGKQWKPATSDVSQTIFQLILFPHMMALEPPLASPERLKSLPVDLPIYIIHGTGDDVCPVSAADALYAALKARGMKRLVYRRVEVDAHCAFDLQINHWMVDATNAAWEAAF